MSGPLPPSWDDDPDVWKPAAVIWLARHGHWLLWAFALAAGLYMEMGQFLSPLSMRTR